MPRISRAVAPVKAGPFLKWAGGKGRLLGQYEPLFPKRFNRYFEPFVGAGAVFFHLEPQKAHLSDTNPDLIACYQVIRDELPALIEVLRMYRHDKDFYYHVRELNPADLSAVQRAARMIFLNKTCFNGLWRVNRRGQFNVPFGDYKNPKILDEDNLHAVSQALQGVEIQLRSFDEVVSKARRGDFIYLDPPYHPVSSTSNFTSYGADDFKPDDQIRLAAAFRRLDAKGCKVMLSNSDTPFIRELYEDYRIEQVWCRRAINRDAAKRGAISEVVVMNY
ncbi:DNA adenine methylase [bacterium]|nr:DNA adenine methylase [bacterium]